MSGQSDYQAIAAITMDVMNKSKESQIGKAGLDYA